MKSKTDDQLIKLISEGNNQAFEELFNRYSGIFLGYAMSIVNEKSLAEDIVQDTWIKVTRLAQSYQAQGHFVSWAYTMIRNQALNLLKSKGMSQKENLEDVPESEFKKESFEQDLIKNEDHKLVHAAFLKLPEMQRVCMSMWLNEDLSYEEIAHKLEITLASVKTHLHRAKENLRLQFKGSRP